MRFKHWKKKILSFLPKDDAKTVIFINMRKHLDEISLLVKEISEKAKGEVLVVIFNSKPSVPFQRLNINLRLSEDYLQDADYKYIDEYAANLTKTWYLVKDKDEKSVTEYENIQLGSLVEYNFLRFLICRIKNLEVSTRVINLEKPHKIITMEDTGELNDVVKIVAQNNNIFLLSLSQVSLPDLLRTLKTKVRNKLSDIFYFSLFDSLFRIILMRTKLNNLILIDPRAHAMLTGPHQLENFIFCPIAKGLPDRLYALRKKEIYISFETPLCGRLRGQALKQKSEFLKTWDRLKVDPSFVHRFMYKETSIWRLVENEISLFFKKRFPRIIKVIIQVKEFHRRRTIKSIVLRADVREEEKAIIMAAQELNIPTLYITHGVLGENNGHDKLYCTKTAVWGQADFERYLSLGNPPDKLVITGSPKYDRLYFKKLYISKGLIYKRLRLKPQNGFIILATQPITYFSSYWSNDGNEVLLRSVLSAVKGISDIQLVVKLHPFEEYSVYKEILKETNSKDVILVRDINTFALIDASILLLTFNSTAGLEAMILNKPVITINLGKRKDVLPFAERGAALGVYRAQDIKPAIERILTDRALNEQLAAKRKDLVSYYLHKQDGRSSERVVALINRISNNG